jgi:hypothetical protein
MDHGLAPNHTRHFGHSSFATVEKPVLIKLFVDIAAGTRMSVYLIANAERKVH